MRIAIVVAAERGPDMQAQIQLALDLTTLANRDYLRRNSDCPPLQTSGVHWQRETNQHNEERFLTIPFVRVLGWGDCDDLACWRAAELQHGGERDARAVVYAVRPGLWHVVVKRANGKIEDISALLGMGSQELRR